MTNTKRTEIDQDGIARLEAASQVEADFFISAVMLAEVEDESEIPLIQMADLHMSGMEQQQELQEVRRLAMAYREEREANAAYAAVVN